MGLPEILLTFSLILSVVVILYSWKNPLYLIPLFILFLGGVFSQVDLGERLYVQVFEGVRLYLRDIIVVVIIIHVIRRFASMQARHTLFKGPISFLLLYLVGNLCIKMFFFGAEFNTKITPFIRLFSTFAVYYLLVGYLRTENFLPFMKSCYLLCIASVAILLGYVLLLIPLPPALALSLIPTETVGSPSLRFGMPNHFFLFFPLFIALAPLLGYVGKMRMTERLVVVLMIIGSALALYRMYLFVVLFGSMAAFIGGRGGMIRKLALGSVVVVALFFAIQLISEARESGITESFVMRFEGTGEELGQEGASGGGRIVRTYAAFGLLMEPAVLFLGAAFTGQFSEVIAFTTSDLGLVSTALYFGLPALLFYFLVYTRGISNSLSFLKRSDPLGQAAGGLLLFLIAILPGTVFMYNPLESEMFIALWAVMLGTFDGLYAAAQAGRVQHQPSLAS